MEYAGIAIAAIGFTVGTLFRFQVLLIAVALLLLFSLAYSLGSGLSLLNGFLTIMALQTVLQGSYFLGLIFRAAIEAHGPQRIL